MEDEFISGSDLASRYQRCRRTLDRWINKRRFPSPVLSGPGVSSLWRKSEVEQWEAEHMASKVRKAG